jgi:FtsP/CotA-like multicopper oxidase with cupredoxin domain
MLDLQKAIAPRAPSLVQVAHRRQANESLKVAVSFDDRPGSWMFHCHILDHADMGMMALLVVNP